MRRVIRPAGLWIMVIACLCAAHNSRAHLDVARASLSQLFLEADLVAIGHIRSLEERDFIVDGGTERYEVVTATVVERFKGESAQSIDFFQDAHGHAYYRPGDKAVIFLQRIGVTDTLNSLGTAGGIRYVSRQVRDTEYRLGERDTESYRAVLQAYAKPPGTADSSPDQRVAEIRRILLQMLESGSPALTESALLDWENLGRAMQWSDEQIGRLLLVTRDPGKPITLRLAILRVMSTQDLAGPEAWLYLLKHEDEDNMQHVLNSVRGQEDRKMMSSLVGLLESRSDVIVEGAARALGHPVYSGAEPALDPLLKRQSLRLNYAAASALIGINSETARAVLLDAAANHPSDKVRRMIAARMQLISRH
jgi:hypothetical protein